MMCQCKFIDCNKWTNLVEALGSRGGCAWVGGGGIWEASLTSAQFCCEQNCSKKRKLKGRKGGRKGGLQSQGN